MKEVQLIGLDFNEAQ